MIRALVTSARQKLQARRDPVGFARARGVTIGKGVRLLGTHAGTWGSEPYLVTLGDHVTVTGGVRFVTHDGGVWVFRESEPDIDVFGAITVGSNVFIGLNAMLLPGVTVGDDVVVGAGAVVARDIPSNSVAVGVPARVVGDLDRYRERIRDRESHIKSLPAAQKRRLLERRFAPGADG